MARGRHYFTRKTLLHWHQRTILPDQTIENMSCDYNGDGFAMRKRGKKRVVPVLADINLERLNHYIGDTSTSRGRVIWIESDHTSARICERQCLHEKRLRQLPIVRLAHEIMTFDGRAVITPHMDTIASTKAGTQLCLIRRLFH